MRPASFAVAAAHHHDIYIARFNDDRMHTCLIAEADPFIARLLVRYAGACGLEGIRASSGEETVAAARAARPVVAIIDVQLPGALPGWEAVRALQDDAATSAIPIISCSWLDASESRELTGPTAAHLRMPDLPFADFVAALAAAGAPFTAPATGTEGGA